MTAGTHIIELVGASTTVVEIPSEVFFTGVLVAFTAGGIAVVSFLVITLVRTWRPRTRERMVNSHALRANLVVPEDLRPALEHQLAMRVRGGVLGSLVGLAAVLMLLRPWEYPPPSLGLATGPISLGLAFLGTQMGAIAGGMLARRSMLSQAVVARVTPISIADLVAPAERRMAAVAACVAVALPALLLVVLSLPLADAPESLALSAAPLALLGLAAGALYLTLPAIADRLARRRALLGDAAALAWSDALTAQSLRDLHWAVAYIGGLAGFSALMVIGTAVSDDSAVASTIWINVSSYASIILLLVMVALVLVRSPERHVQRTLWPEFAINPQ